ncbi:hypothetical protein NDU88_003389 [Pleurodeles waltl]|uniref:Uncharacterized protein n=1 Tax=Pleurodeles waltl TaxID=8319 RepID=A0AAV7V1L9_PLEWA|nr:hypothetical protein NDU88_003389 [Pleurodeles waltl]
MPTPARYCKANKLQNRNHGLQSWMHQELQQTQICYGWRTVGTSTKPKVLDIHFNQHGSHVTQLSYLKASALAMIMSFKKLVEKIRDPDLTGVCEGVDAKLMPTVTDGTLISRDRLAAKLDKAQTQCYRHLFHLPDATQSSQIHLEFGIYKGSLMSKAWLLGFYAKLKSAPKGSLKELIWQGIQDHKLQWNSYVRSSLELLDVRRIMELNLLPKIISKLVAKSANMTLAEEDRQERACMAHANLCMSLYQNPGKSHISQAT